MLKLLVALYLIFMIIYNIKSLNKIARLEREKRLFIDVASDIINSDNKDYKTILYNLIN